MNVAPRRSEPLQRPTRPPFVSSGKFTPTLIAVLCAILLGIAWERGRGNFHRLTSAVLKDQPEATRPSGPGGEDAIRLFRTPDALDGKPEFLSATFLPGRGMNLLQLTAQIPGRGEVQLFEAPSLQEVTSQLTGAGPDSNGALSATFGGPFLVPWAGRLAGKPSVNSSTLQTLWLGQRLTFPASAPGSLLSTPGLLLDRGADTTKTDVILDGQNVDATFHPGTFSGNWPSTGSVHVAAEMTGHTMDLTVSVQNTGDTPMPVGIGWLPYFAIPSHDRANVGLTIPSTTRLEVDRNTSVPTGRSASVAGTSLDFASARGARLGNLALDETYTHLTAGALANNPVAVFRDTSYGYGVRIIPLTSNIHALRVLAPVDKPWVAIGPETNVDDPLGSQWNSGEPSGITTLQPGDTVQWKVRLEIFSFNPGDRTPGA